MHLQVLRSRWFVDLILPVCAGLAVWAWYGLLEAVLVTAVAAVIVLSHMARRWVRDQLVYQPKTDHAHHADSSRGGNRVHG